MELARGSTRAPLEWATQGAVQRGRELGEKALRYHWDFYSALQYQRANSSDLIRRALTVAAEGPFMFHRWQRVVDYQYSLQPLSSASAALSR